MARYPRTTPAISTASLPVLARRFRADPHEVGRIEGIGPDLWKLVSSLTRASTSRAAGELVDQGPAQRGQRRTRRPGPASAASRTLQKIVGAIVGAAYRVGHEHLQGSSPPRSTQLDKIFDQALILWCGMVTCGRAEIPVLGRDMGALGFKFPTTHRAYGGAGSELRRAEGGMVRSSEGTQRRSFSSLG